MIRINLLAGERRAVKSAGRSFDIGQKVTVIGSLILLVTVLLVGWRYWSTVVRSSPAALQMPSFSHLARISRIKSSIRRALSCP